MRRLFWTTAELLNSGWSRSRITHAVRDGALVPVRKGHYCVPDAPPDVVRAVRVGGLATATTAGRALGLWTPRDDRLHVALPLTAARPRDPDDAGRPLSARGDVMLHWSDRVRPAATTLTRIVPVPLLLEHALRSLPPELAIALVDSALHLRHLRTTELSALAAAVPNHLARVVGMAEPRCESGLESVACYLLRTAGLTVQVQVDIPGVGRVDLLVEGRLIVELDGRQWHDTPTATSRDRRRDAAAAAQRYRTLRFDAGQVLTAWPSVLAAVLNALP